MKGNVFYTVPKVDENKIVPEKLGERYIYQAVGMDVIPTWLQLQKNLTLKFGAPMYKMFNGEEFLVMEFDVSSENGEVKEIGDLGEGVDAPNYTMWDADSLRKFDWDSEEKG